MTQTFGVGDAGSICKIYLTSGAYTLLHMFTAAGNDSDQPSAWLTLFKGLIYGVIDFSPG